MPLITGLSPAREQALMERLFLRIARDIEPRLRREIKRTMNQLARSADHDAILAAHEGRMYRILTRAYNLSFNASGQRIWEASKKHMRGLETKRDTSIPTTPQFDAARKRWIESVGAMKVTEIAGTTREQAIKIIDEALAEAVELGYGEREAARLIRSKMAEKGGQLSRLRSRIIARTESHQAATASAQIAAKSSGLPMKKEWIASGGDRSRDSHNDANGQIRPIDEPFAVGMDLLMYPGDPSGSAEEVINCRCVVGYSL